MHTPACQELLASMLQCVRGKHLLLGWSRIVHVALLITWIPNIKVFLCKVGSELQHVHAFNFPPPPHNNVHTQSHTDTGWSNATWTRTLQETPEVSKLHRHYPAPHQFLASLIPRLLPTISKKLTINKVMFSVPLNVQRQCAWAIIRLPKTTQKHIDHPCFPLVCMIEQRMDLDTVL